MPQPLNLTFGIELTCIIRYPRAMYFPALEAKGLSVRPHSGSKHDHELSKIVRQHITLYLRDRGFAVCHDPQEQLPQEWTISSSSTSHSSPISQDPDHTHCTIKLASPTLPLTPTSLAETEAILSTLHSIPDLNFHTDTSCNLHIHISTSHNPFPLQTLKNLCMLTSIFETQFSSLHPAHQVHSVQHVKRQNEAFVGKCPWEIAMDIQICRDVQELVERWSDREANNDDFACILRPLLGERGFKTVEFRHYEGTKEIVAIREWIGLTCGLVRYAHEVRFEDLLLLVERLAFDCEMTVVHLFSALKLDEAAIHHGGCEICEYL